MRLNLEFYCPSNYTKHKGDASMSKENNSLATKLSTLAKIWLIIYLLINFVFLIISFYSKNIILPYTGFALINIYGIFSIFLEGKHGFHTICGAEIIFFLYTLVTTKPIPYYIYSAINLLLILITFSLVYKIFYVKHS